MTVVVPHIAASKPGAWSQANALGSRKHRIVRCRWKSRERSRSNKTLHITSVIPSLQGDASTQAPPDLPSFIFKERIVYLGMTLVPSVTELILAELLYLQYEDNAKPIYLYINSTGTSKEGQKYGYDTEAFAIYDTMKYVNPPVHTVAVGTAWGEAAMLLSSGEKGHRAALPSASIMIKQPINAFRGQASELEIQRKEIRTTKQQTLDILSKGIGRPVEALEKDINRPKYFDPWEAVDYGLIDQVLDGRVPES
mmetsp:Transcript_63794/g.154243  ORF Transcript_63794/g.154243 Transcript_63794/m.154243 type:complete len:253 (+) Transcript_63794:96-854(+)